MTEQEILQALTNGYVGDQMPYIGLNDPHLSFMGNQTSFLNESSSGVQFGFNIKNNTGAQKTICINPAYISTMLVSGANVLFTKASEISAAGYPVDAVIDDGTILDGGAGATVVVTPSRSTSKVRDFLNFVKRNPTRITKMEISAGARAQLEFFITKYPINPFIRERESYINVGEFIKETNNIDNKVTITGNPLQFDDQSLIIMELKKDADLNFNFYVGAVQNDAGLLNNKAVTATQNIQAKGIRAAM